MNHAGGGDPHRRRASRQLDGSTPDCVPERSRRRPSPMRQSHSRPQGHHDQGSVPPHFARDASRHPWNYITPSLANILQSPDVDAGLSHLVLPPIRDALLRGDSLGNAPLLAPHLVQHSESVAPPNTQRDIVTQEITSETLSTCGSLLVATGPDMRSLEESLDRAEPRQPESSRRLAMPDGKASVASPPSQYFDHSSSILAVSERENYGQGRSWPPVSMTTQGLAGDRYPADWSRHSVASRSRWRDEAWEHEGMQLQRIRSANASTEDTKIHVERWNQPGATSGDNVHQQSTLRPRPRTSCVNYEPQPWHGEDPSSRTRSSGASSRHGSTALPQASLNDNVAQIAQNTAPDMRDLASDKDLETAERMCIADLERRRDQIAALTTELLFDLDGPPETRRERLRRVERYSHEIMRQVQDLESFVNTPLPSRATPNARGGFQQPNTSSLSASRTNDIITRLQQTNPEAAEQAARDMAAIRARTHGISQRPLGTEKLREKPSGMDEDR